MSPCATRPRGVEETKIVLNKPSKRGDYVQINGRVWPVKGKRQIAAAVEALGAAKRRTAPIERWNGSAWVETGTVLHSA